MRHTVHSLESLIACFIRALEKGGASEQSLYLAELRQIAGEFWERQDAIEARRKEPTQSQERVLAFIREHVSEHGLPPTRVEIAKELGFRSANAAEEHLRALARKGCLRLVPGIARGIRLVEAA